MDFFLLLTWIVCSVAYGIERDGEEVARYLLPADQGASFVNTTYPLVRLEIVPTRYLLRPQGTVLYFDIPRNLYRHGKYWIHR